MGLQLWRLGDVLVFVPSILALPIPLTILYTMLVVFRCMGRNYEFSLIASGFDDIAPGSTTTAAVNMTAIVQKHGAAYPAFIIVLPIRDFLIDTAKVLTIGLPRGV